MEIDDVAFIRQALEVAVQAARRGDHAFGAVLVCDGQVILTAGNTVNTDRDVTRHAELNLISRAAQAFPAEVLARSTLYTSTEPCVMCTGALYWAGVARVVYSCSAAALAQHVGGDWAVPCRDVLTRLHSAMQVAGPVLEAEGLAVHTQFTTN